MKYEDQFLFGNSHSCYKLTACPTPGADKSSCSAPSLHHLVITSAAKKQFTTEKKETQIITKHTGLQECLPGFGSQDTTHQPLLPLLLTKPTGLGFSDVLSAVSNTSLIQKLGTSANKLMFKKEQEQENLS